MLKNLDKGRHGPSIGVDIGSAGVRAVELATGGRGAQVVRFGQVGLPPGAVVGGEVQDVPAVAEALRRLWTDVGFSSHRVTPVVSGQRMIVRQAQVPLMTESDFRSALRFQAMELLPIPVDDSLIDFEILGEWPGAGSGADMTILLAAAHREVVRGQLAALRDAGLSAGAIDVAPLAAARVLERSSTGQLQTYAIVDVGADLTTIVVCHQGYVKFSRTINAGGRSVTSLLAQRTGMELAVAEAAKRQAATDATTATAVKEAHPLVSEIEGSLSFFAAQLEAGALETVFLTGGSSQDEALITELRQRLDGTVTLLDLFAGIDADNLPAGLSAEAMKPYGLLALGAAELALVSGGHQIDLMPPEVANALKRRRLTITMAGGLVVVLAGLGALTAVQHRGVGRAHAARAALMHQNAEFARQIGELSGISGIQQATASRTKEAQTAVSGEIAWNTLVSDLRRALPKGLSLTSLQLTSTSGGTSTTGSSTSSTASSGSGTSSSSSPSNASSSTASGASAGIGGITMGVVGDGGEQAVAEWLRAMATVPGLSNPWVSTASASGAQVTFSGTATIGSGAPMVAPATATEAQK